MNRFIALFVLLFIADFLFSQTYNVDSYGAAGDGVTDDYTAIQNAIWDLRGTGGTLYFTSGKTYIISEGLTFNTFPDTHNYLVTSTGAEKATIKVQDSTILHWYHWGIRLSQSKNITIENLTIDGNRDTRNPTVETSGTSVMFIDGASDGTRLNNLNLINSPMDNVYIVVHENYGETQMTDFEMHNCKLENAFRNNMSVISGENFKIIGCEFNNANGTDPQSGIDFEPDYSSANGYKNMTIEGCKFKNNVRYGIELTYKIDSSGFSTIKNNLFENNGILIGSKNNKIHHNIFVKQDHQHLHSDQTRDGIIYFHANQYGENNDVFNNYFYDNPMPPGSHLVNFMYHSGGNNHLHDNYGHGNTVAGFVLNNTWSGTPPQIISNNEFINRKEMGYWTMDNADITGTTIDDLSYFGNDGNMVNSPASIQGKVNEALDFAPDDKYIQIDTSNNLNIQMNITLSAWIKWNGANAGEPEQVIMGRGDDWRFGVSNAGQLEFYAPHTGDTTYTAGWIQSDVGDTIPTGEWTHVAFTYDGRISKLYINAVEVASEQANGVIGTAYNKIFIGAKDTTALSFNGSIDEVKIYNYALDIEAIEKARGVNYYVDFTSGNDTNQGTSPAAAWKTITKVNYEMNNFIAGDSILFKRGEVWNEDRLYIENISGSSLNDIVFGAYGSGAKPVFNAVVVKNHNWTDTGNNIWKATNPPADNPQRMLIDGVEKLRANIQSELDGVNFFWRYNDTTNDLYLYSTIDPNGVTEVKYATDFPMISGDAEYITIRDLDLQGGWAALYINTNSKNITLDSLNIGKYAGDGVVTNTSSGSPSEYPANININNCNFDAFFTLDYSMAGTYYGSSDRGCGDGIRYQACVGGELKNSYFKNWGHASISLDGGVNKKVYNLQIHDNYLTSPDICYGGRLGVDDAHDNELYNNQIVNTSVQSQINGYSNHYHHNIVDLVRNTPLLTDEKGVGFNIAAYSNTETKDNIYENNVILNTEGVGIEISGNNNYSIYNNIIRNNIIYNCGTSVNGKSIDVNVNLYDSTYDNSILNNSIFSSITTQTCEFGGTLYDVAGFNAQNGVDGYVILNNIADNPQFVDEPNDDFHLQSSSPCIDAGADGLSDRDYDGKPIPLLNKPDIGAYEYGIFWNGNISHYWNIAGNWSNGQVPDTNTRVTIPTPNQYKHCPIIYDNRQVKSLFLNQNAKMIIYSGKMLGVSE